MGQMGEREGRHRADAEDWSLLPATSLFPFLHCPNLVSPPACYPCSRQHTPAHCVDLVNLPPPLAPFKDVVFLLLLELYNAKCGPWPQISVPGSLFDVGY